MLPIVNIVALRPGRTGRRRHAEKESGIYQMTGAMARQSSRLSSNHLVCVQPNSHDGCERYRIVKNLLQSRKLMFSSSKTSHVNFIVQAVFRWLMKAKFTFYISSERSYNRYEDESISSILNPPQKGIQIVLKEKRSIIIVTHYYQFN